MSLKCKPTDIPSIEDIDIPAILKKYQYERDRRLRPEGQAQYGEPEGVFSRFYEVDLYTPVSERPPISENIDVAVLGGGFGGVLTAYHLKQAGISHFRNIDHAGDFGGCWYWNRYPGVECDNDAYVYFPLLEEMGYMPSRKFAPGYEIREYIQSIARKSGLYDSALFHTRITALRWDDSLRRWRIATNRGDEICARFVIMSVGPLNKPKLPGIPGLKDFRGKIFHTARWDYEFTGGSQRDPRLDRLKDKSVAVIGTGASAIQIVPHLGRYAKQLYVIQRTPSSVDERNNQETDPEWVKTLKPGWHQEYLRNFQRGLFDGLERGEPDLICDIWTEINRNISCEREQAGWPELSMEQMFALRGEHDNRTMERLRRRVDALVNDKETAEALKPYYRFLCKRPCSNDLYYSTFNRSNVKLIDVSDTQGLERMTEEGFMYRGEEYPVDGMILASGFEMTSNLKRRWGIDVIEGRDGLSIYDHWNDGYRTFHGMTSHGFPNQFFVGFIQGGVHASTTETFGQQGRHIAYIIRQTLERGANVVEPSKEAQDEWVSHVHETQFDIEAFQRECTPGYYNNEGEKKFRYFLGEGYGPGPYAFRQLIEGWRSEGSMRGMLLSD